MTADRADGRGWNHLRSCFPNLGQANQKLSNRWTWPPKEAKFAHSISNSPPPALGVGFQGNTGGWAFREWPRATYDILGLDMKSRIMYIENKSSGLSGPARIGRVTFSKTGKTLEYKGTQFRSLKGQGFKANFYDIETGEEYWISGPKRDGSDQLYGGRDMVAVDEDVKDEYRTQIRGKKTKKKK